MKFSEAIDKIAAAYVPGVVRFYEKQTPNPWSEMLEAVETLLASPDPEMQQAAAELYCRRALELIAAFKATGSRPEGIQPIDAFLMGPGGNLRAAESRRRKVCYRCEAKDGLSIEPYGPELLQVRLVCARCKESRKV